MNKLEIKNVSHNYTDGMKKKKVLKDVSISFESGKFYAILGESGSGKTTLPSIMSGLLKPESGEILFNEEKLNYLIIENDYLELKRPCMNWMNLLNY